MTTPEYAPPPVACPRCSAATTADFDDGTTAWKSGSTQINMACFSCGLRFNRAEAIIKQLDTIQEVWKTGGKASTLFEDSLRRLDLTVRCVKVVKRLGIATVSQLLNTHHQTLIDQKNFGTGSMVDLEQALATEGLVLHSRTADGEWANPAVLDAVWSEIESLNGAAFKATDLATGATIWMSLSRLTLPLFVARNKLILTRTSTGPVYRTTRAALATSEVQS